MVAHFSDVSRPVMPLLDLVDTTLKALRNGQVGQRNRVPTVNMYERRWTGGN